MAAREKLLDRMRRSPHANWEIGDLKAIADRHGIGWRNPSGSHIIFLPESGPILSVPARRPIKPVYIRLFVEMIARVRKE
jgi:hypothetical protein